MIPFDVASFKGPNFSVFDMSHDNKLDMGLGRVVPVYWKIMHPHERIQTEIGNLVRMQPLNGAILQHYDITFDSFFIPMRLIFGKERSERFFNLWNSRGASGFEHGGLIPQLPWDLLVKYSKSGSLLDYLCYPTFPNLRAYAADRLSKMEVWDGAKTTSGSHKLGTLMDNITLYPSGEEYTDLYFYFTNFSGAESFFRFQKTNTTTWPNKPFDFYAYLSYLYYGREGIIIQNLESLLTKLGVSSEKAFEMYVDYYIKWQLSFPAVGTAKQFFFANTFVSDLVSQGHDAPSVLPLLAYWRVISDWYFNYNLADLPTYELYDTIIESSMDSSSALWSAAAAGVSGLGLLWTNWSSVDGPTTGFGECFRRNWANDYFTSAFASSQSGQAVPIPSNGNIPNLRRANVLQEMYERVLYAGRRYRDQVRAFFGVVPANSRLDVVEVISRETQPLQISEVTQNNQAQFDSMLQTPFGSFGGQSQTTGSHKLSDYTSDEHGIYMVVASIRPRAAYFQGVRRELLKYDVYDFLWPQFESIGEQAIEGKEIFADFDPAHYDATDYFDADFGFQRRYAEFMYHPSEVHGDLQNSLDYLHAARKFSTMPNLNVNFGEINPDNDDLNRVFVYSADERPFVVELYFDSKMIRPLSRYLHYDL